MLYEQLDEFDFSTVESVAAGRPKSRQATLEAQLIVRRDSAVRFSQRAFIRLQAAGSTPARSPRSSAFASLRANSEPGDLLAERGPGVTAGPLTAAHFL